MGVETPIPAYNRMESARELCRDLYGGTDIMKAAGEKWLPREAKETPAQYDARIARAYLYNVYKWCVKDLTGKVFATPFMPKDDSDEIAKEWSKDIDLQGNTLDTFCNDLFEDSLNNGQNYILVDRPTLDEGATRADDLKPGNRPYFVLVPAEALIGWKSEVRNGEPIITEIRIREIVTGQDPEDEWNEIEIDQIRVYGENTWETYQEGDSKGDDWVKVGEGKNSLGFVPIVPFYTNRTGFWESVPFLRDLADINLTWWQSNADQRNILHYSRVPMLLATGFNEKEIDDGITMGVQEAIKSTSANADIKFIELKGKSIESGREDIQDLEERMTKLSYEVKFKAASATAYEIATQRSENETALRSMANNLVISVKMAFVIMGLWIGRELKVELEISDSFDETISQDAELNSLNESRRGGDLSRRTMWAEMKRRGILSESFDPNEEEERLVAEFLLGTESDDGE